MYDISRFGDFLSGALGEILIVKDQIAAYLSVSFAQSRNTQIKQIFIRDKILSKGVRPVIPFGFNPRERINSVSFASAEHVQRARDLHADDNTKTDLFPILSCRISNSRTINQSGAQRFLFMARL